MQKINLTGTVFDLLRKSVAELNVRAFVIGGFVRDEILGRPCKDIDVVVEGSGIELAKKMASLLGKGVNVNIFKNFGTAMIHLEDLELEFVGARKESYRSDSRKPIVEDGTIQEDQERRDFTINALAVALHTSDNAVIDPFGGLEDLKNGILRTPLAPDQTYSDDPLRMMRAIRFASQLGFVIEKASLEAISKNKERIRIVSKERIAEELNKIVLSPVPSIGFKHLFDTGLLKIIFPEMAALFGVDIIKGKAHKDNFYHTLQVLDNIC
ncbi:MAG: hypothetical protein RLZZ543_236, partial [Bacteroidota bacterium]